MVGVLVFAFGGTATAARLITGRDIRNASLTGNDIESGSITGSDVRSGSITGSDVRSGSITGSDIRSSSITGGDIRRGSITSSDLNDHTERALDGKDGTKGDRGARRPARLAGPRGAQGPAGRPGAGAGYAVDTLVPFHAGDSELAPPAWGSVRGASLDRAASSSARLRAGPTSRALTRTR